LSRHTTPGVLPMPNASIASPFAWIAVAIEGCEVALTPAGAVHGLPWFSSILRNTANLSVAASMETALGMLVGPSVATGIHRTCNPLAS